MPWTKGKIEKAWRIIDKSFEAIADALDVPVNELKALLLEGALPKYDRDEPVWLDETPPAPTPEIVEHLAKRATLADLAPPAPEVVLEAAAPIIEKPLQFRAEPKRPAYVAPVSQPAHNAVPAVDDVIEGRALPPMPPRTRAHAYIAPGKKAEPAKVHLMHEGKYLHESCMGLVPTPANAWRQPPSKVAAVRRKFPETVDYEEVPAK